MRKRPSSGQNSFMGSAKRGMRVDKKYESFQALQCPIIKSNICQAKDNLGFKHLQIDGSSPPQNQVVSLIPSLCSVAKVQKMHQFVSASRQKVCLCISTKRESSVTTAVVTNLRKPAAGRIPRNEGRRMEIMTPIQPFGWSQFWQSKKRHFLPL